jgi:membrane-associated phospholipid phosphatase
VILSGLVLARAYRRARATLPRRRALVWAARPALAVVRDFLPFLGFLLLYETLHDLTPLLRPSVVDAQLIAIDRALLHVDGAVWLGRFASAPLTQVMVFCYCSYFFTPGLLACWFYWRDERQPFRDFLVSLCVVTLLGYIGYLLVPAVGPYVYQSTLFPTRLPGGSTATHVFISAIDDMKGVARDCFPSLHTAHTTVVLTFAWLHARRLFWLYLPIALGLYLSTIYLRMHYVVDVAAGLMVAAAGCALGVALERRWYATPRS